MANNNDLIQKARAAGLPDWYIQQKLNQQTSAAPVVTQPQVQQQVVPAKPSGSFVGNLARSIARPFTNTAAMTGEALYTLGRYASDPAYRRVLSGNTQAGDIEKITAEGDTLRGKLRNSGAVTEGDFLDRLLIDDKRLSNRKNIARGTGGDLLGLAAYGVPVGGPAASTLKTFGQGALAGGLFGASDVIGENVEASASDVAKGTAIGGLAGGSSAVILNKLAPALFRKLRGTGDDIQKTVLNPTAKKGSNPAALPDIEDDLYRKAQEFGLKGSAKNQLKQVNTLRNQSIKNVDDVLSKNNKLLPADDVINQINSKLDDSANIYLKNEKVSDDMLARELRRLQKTPIDDETTKLVQKMKGSSRPVHQKEIEKLVNAGDMQKARALIDALPEGDAYKKSMISMMDKIAPETKGGSITTKQLFDYKIKLGNRINWNSTADKHEILKDIWYAVDDVLTKAEPGIKQETLKQATLRDLATGLAKRSTSSKGNYKIPFVNVTAPTKRAVETAQSSVGKNLSKLPADVFGSSTVGTGAAIGGSAIANAGEVSEPIIPEVVDAGGVGLDAPTSPISAVPSTPMEQFNQMGEQSILNEVQQDPQVVKKQIAMAVVQAGGDVKDVQEALQLYELLSGTPTEQEKKSVPASSLMTYSDIKLGQSIMGDLVGTVQESSDIMGPISGRARKVNPYDTRTQVFDAKMRATAQIVGKAMEGGVLRKEDEIKYRNMLPNINDTPAVALGKIQQVKAMLDERERLTRSTLETGGYTLGADGIPSTEPVVVPSSPADLY